MLRTFVELRNLQVALHNLARDRVGVRVRVRFTSEIN